MSDVSLKNVRKTYGGHIAVDGVDLDVAQGDFVTLLGPSGCGKTTCLRMIAGFVTPTSGRVLIRTADVTNLPAYRRNTGMVFQSYALFPHHTVAGNVAFGLKVRRLSRAECDQRTRDVLRLVRLDHLADRYPSQLSGGQRQRVALARAVVINPDILLLDEPLGALDLKLREELQVEIKRVQSELGMTTLFVTHDQGEALSMSTRIAVMRDGKIVQIGTPNNIYEHPNCRYVANFVGKINFIPVVVQSKESESCCRVALDLPTDDESVTFAVSGSKLGSFAIGDRCVLAIRPEHLHFNKDARENSISMKTTNVTYLGNVWQVEGLAQSAGTMTILARSGDHVPALGDMAKIYWKPENSFLLKED